MEFKKVLLKYFSAVVILFVSFNCFSQQIIVDEKYNGLTWSEFSKELGEKNNYNIFLLLDSITTNTPIKNISDSIFLDDYLKLHSVDIIFDDQRNGFISKTKINTSFPDKYFESFIVSVKDTTSELVEKKYLNTKSEYVDNIITIGKSVDNNTNKLNKVSGYVYNLEDGEPVIGAAIYIKELNKGVVSSVSGYYVLNIPKGEYTIELSSIGRKNVKKTINVLSDGQFDIKLEQDLVALDEVVVTAEKYDIVNSNKLGFEKIPVKNIRQIPAILGERDVLKVALMLPGIQNTGEGSSGFNVRGSPADQNLFYIDNVPLYNTSHLFGFFSVFNSDAISDFSIYKGHIPVNYGGRLASIFEVTTKNGNDDNFSARGGISPITGKILVEGPVKKIKGNYLAAFRTTYSDWLLKLVKDPDIRNSSGRFQDALINMSFDISPEDKVKIFTYQSYDRVNLSGDIKYDYSNQGYSLRWNHIIRQKHFFNLDIVHTKYQYSEENNESEISSYKHNYSLYHDEAKISVEFEPSSKHLITIGSNAILYNLHKGKHNPLTEISTVTSKNLGKEKGLESSLFISDNWNLNSRFNISFGARINYYAYLGKQKTYQYLDNVEWTVNNIVDTLYFNNNQIIKNYINPDYRISAKYLLFSNTSIKVSYNILHQNIFMLTNTVSISPSDKWKLSDNHIKPLSGEQYSIGIYQKLFRGKMDFSIESYYKEVANLVEYKDGAELLVNDIIETDVLQGDLTTYGVELSLKKPLGKFNGWLNYVYSKSSVLVDSEIQGNSINFGNKYPSNYEKPHAVNIVGNYQISRRFSISSNLVYSTGRPITYPSASYTQGGMRVVHYSQRNEFRIPDYFRIDLSIGIEGNLLAKKLAHGSWMFSVYNLTGRKNAYSVYFKNENGAIKGYKLSIFGNPIYTITYNFKLGNYAS